MFTYRSIWLGDLHLGHPAATPHLAPLQAFLDSCACTHLYLMGDIDDVFEREAFPHHYDAAVSAGGLAALDIFRARCQSVNGIYGNHDPVRPFSLSSLLWVNDKGNLMRGTSQTGRAWIAVHGHAQDYLWRLGELLEPRTGPWPQPQGDTLAKREKIVTLSGAFRRLANAGRRAGVDRVIHGHVHMPGVRLINGVQVICIPDWLNHTGGALVEYDDGRMALVDAHHDVMQAV